MARDLIPPPSPAGRPAPDGTPNLIELPPDVTPTVEATSLASSGPSEFRNRFGFLIGGLGGVIIAAAAVAAIVLTTGGTPDEGLYGNWSKWKPQETTLTAGPAEIATHVAPQYRGENGKQLVDVKGGPMVLQGIQFDNVILRSAAGNITTYPAKHAVLYTLSGLGTDGSITDGKPSVERHQLLRREALELALYSFRYLPDVNMVMTQLPPPPTSAADSAAASSSSSSATTAPAKPQIQAVFYRAGDLKPQLQVPLGATVPAKAPTPNAIPAAEAQKIDSLTLSNLFLRTPQQAQDYSVNMILDRPKG
jgi:hypothetical protein